MKILSNDDILSIINGDESEIEISSDEEAEQQVETDLYAYFIEEIEVDDENSMTDVSNMSSMSNTNEEVHSNEFIEAMDLVEEMTVNDESGEINPYCDMQITLTNKIKWKKNAVFEDMRIPPFHTQETDAELLLPINYFYKYIPENLFESFADNTNLYAVRQNVQFTTTVKEIKQFIGLHIITGVLKYPRIKMYWDRTFRQTLFSDTMPVNRFFNLRNYLHCVDNDTARSDTDKLWKVRPIYNNIKQRCKNIPKDQKVCIDEQIVPFKGNTVLKVYMKNKPNPRGIKIFLLCGADGIAYDFLIYQGKQTEINPVVSKKFGPTTATVLHLADALSGGNYKLFCDNYFLSYSLMKICTNLDIYITGTVRLNRFGKPPFSEEKKFQKKICGHTEQLVSTDGIAMVKWLDNKPVILSSNCFGGMCNETVERWDRRTKSNIDVPIPNIIKEYNQCMGGVDKFNFLLSLYRTSIKSKKWTIKMIFHAIDFAITNSRLEYRRSCDTLEIPKKKVMDLMHFRLNIGESLIKSVYMNKRKPGRPLNNSSESISNISTRKNIEKRPIASVQHDKFDHFPEHMENRITCKFSSCSGKSRWKCKKCDIHLCLEKNKNCFLKFHELSSKHDLYQ